MVLIITDFDANHPIGLEISQGSGCNSPVGLKPIRSAIKSKCGIEIPHLPVQSGNHVRSYIRWIRHDYVETAMNRRKPVAFYSLKPCTEPIGPCIGPRHAQGTSSGIDTNTRRLRTFAKQSKQNGPGARSEIENTHLALHLDDTPGMRQHAIDQNFRVRPRFERLRRKRERQAVEVTLAQNAVNWFTPPASLKCIRNTGELRVAHRPVALRQKRRRRKIEKTGKQNAGIRCGLGDAGLAECQPQPGLKRGQRLRTRHRPISPSRASWSA